ncbi:MAG: class I SAM-dependent methyltransferase [Pseudomonadota bacterium]
MADRDYDLDRAYQIDGPEDARRLYGEWAKTYDDNFGAAWGYIAPRKIAELYLDEMSPEDQPVLDIGAGTGLVGEHLKTVTVDGIDITPEMLEIARRKDRYRSLIEGDLTKPLNIASDSYGGVISSGTFTHGHVGPECLPELLRITRAGGLFCCGTIGPVLDGAAFGSVLARMVAEEEITPVSFVEIEIYDETHHDHAGDLGLVMVFRKR